MTQEGTSDHLGALVKRKSIIKGQFTRIANYIKTKGRDCTFDELNSRLTKINELYNQFIANEDKVFQLNPDAESDMLELDDQYFPLIAEIQVLIRAINLQLGPVTGYPSSKNEDAGEQSFTNNFRSDFKLPRLTLPVFDGNYRQWQAFYDVFSSTVHENTTLSPAQKFKYLLGQLRGPAYTTICHFRVDDANYVEALKRLIKKYDKKKTIVETYICDFLSQPKLTSTPSASGLMKIYDSVDETIRGLKSLGPGASERDPWIVYLATEKLDEESKQLWRYETAEQEFPTIDQFLGFVSRRMEALGNAGSKRIHNAPKLSPSSKSFYVTKEPACPLCTDERHKLFKCNKFRKMRVDKRRELMKSLNRCYNCLSDEHIVSQCKNSKGCFKCKKRHNTLLHLENPANNPEISNNKNEMSHTESSPLTSQEGKIYVIPAIQNDLPKAEDIKTYLSPNPPSISMLPTAEIEIEDKFGRWTKCRALLDSGSTHSFITENCVSYLGIPRAKASISIDTLNGTRAGMTKGVSDLKVRSCIDHDYKITIQAYIIPRICSKLPSQLMDISNSHIRTIHPLADPEFYQPRQIDILLGCEHLFHALTDGKIKHIEGSAIAHNTRFGWVIGGNFNPNKLNPYENRPRSMHIELNQEQGESSSLEHSLQRFWESEEIINPSSITADENTCIKHFHDNVLFQDNRISLPLPFKRYPPTLGDSYNQALRRYLSLEKRLDSDIPLKKAYVSFLHEYLSLGHMEAVPPLEIQALPNKVYYMPHHPVVKSSSTTTKVRVVFNASAKTTTGESLNNNLLVGPVIQQNLINILIRFRQHRFVISADIEKMFRQILIHPKDRDYQRIIWREGPTSNIQHFRLRTITYGTAPAPFLATQALHYLADRFSDKFPIGSEVLKRDFYMDDLMSGGETLEATLQLQKELICLLELGGFNLRKWSANHPSLLESIPPANRELSSWEIGDESKIISVLGIKYDPIKDNFFFQASLPKTNKFTKRTFLSEISRIFDPLGLVSPVTIRLKILFQLLWLRGIGWDDELPPDIEQEWILIRTQLNELTKVKFSRWIYAPTNLELHGFSDASKDAYAAVIYARVVEGTVVRTNLIAAKTKVAPIKTISIPRLELNAATLLVRLLELVQRSLCLSASPKVFLYTDSKITLDRLSKPPKLWKTYIANRTSKVLTCTSRSQWYHVSSNQNPADCATRSISPEEFISNRSWFDGPDFLRNHDHILPIQEMEPESVFGDHKAIAEFHLSGVPRQASIVNVLSDRISSYRKLTRIIGFVIRFIRNLRLEPHQRIFNCIRATEMREAEYVVFRQIQEITYANEIMSLKKSLPLNASSNLHSFFPFIDAHGLLRVGGRLDHADLEYDTKHPIILPSSHVIIERMVRERHVQHLHAGPKLLHTILKQRIMIPRARNLIRRIIRQCMVCCRHNAVTQQQLMGQLPAYRVNPPVRAFIQTGIDLAGPFAVKTHRHRAAKIFKAYLVIYVCMATKATTLDLVSDMSTDTFLRSLQRFCATRGVPSDIYCDNGSNLVGAKKQLREFYDQYLSQARQADILNWCTDHYTQWHFIPPAAPTFGGLWESTVKSAKYHLRRVIGDSKLTYEEFLTLIKQVEALLNSRPLGELHEDDFNPLTPGHFIIGQPICMLPVPSLQQIKFNQLSRWQLIQSMLQGFWQR